jgi:putative ABC transport system permease protein
MRRRFRRLFRHTPDRPDQLAREIDDEIAAHLAERIERLEQLGMTADAARAEALRRFGDLADARRELNDSARQRGSMLRAHERTEERSAMIHGLRQDARFALRTLRLHKSFAVATVATLGLVIAAMVTAFSFADALFLRPLPVPSAGRLVRVYLARSSGGFIQVGAGGADLLRARPDVFERVATTSRPWVKFVRERGSLEQRYTAFASSELFPMLGLAPALGRFFLPGETAADSHDPVAVISYSLWQRGFGSDPRAVGEHVLVSNVDFTIVGVAPPGFVGVSAGLSPTELWLPSTMGPAVGIGCKPAIPCNDMDVLARLAPGVSPTRAAVGLENLGAALSHVAVGDDTVRRPVVLPASGALISTQRQLAPLARLLGAIAVLLLVIGCANLSGLLIVRSVARAREVALRLSLGANRLRIMQQLLVESSAMAVFGGALGVVLSVWTSRALMGFFVTDSEGFQNYFPIGIDARVLWFAVVISLVAMLASGVLPAFLAARAEPADVLKSGSAGSGSARSRFELVAVQVALTTALLSGAVLLSRSFAHLIHAQQFDADHVALLRVRPQAAQYDTLRSEQYVRTVAERLARLPGVESVGFARGAGFAWRASTTPLDVGMAPGDSTHHVLTHFVSPGFFHALRVNVLEGREFSEADGPSAPLVVMVSRSLARALSPTSDVVGRTLYVRGKAFRIVGMVPDYLVRTTGDPVTPMVFFAFWQNALGPEADARFVIRMHGDAANALGTLERAARAVDPAVPVAEVMTLVAQMDLMYPEIRLGQTVLLAAGGLALLLSAIGLYGVIAFVVVRRTRDIGLRIALGALPVRVAGQLVGSGMTAVVAGLAVGLGGAWMLSHVLGSWLVGVAPHDLPAFAITAAMVCVASLVACAIPARRAARIDPAIALRVE